MEQNVDEANERVERGVVELDKANAYQKAARKKKCILIVIFLAVLTAILVPTIIATSNTNTANSGTRR